MSIRLKIISAVLSLGLLPAGASAATFQGEFWNTETSFRTLAEVDAAIAGRLPSATFRSSVIDYPGGAVETAKGNLTLSEYLGKDAASLSGLDAKKTGKSVFRFSGLLDLDAGVQSFTVGSDDGFRLTVGGVVIAERDTARKFSQLTVESVMSGGPQAFELLYYEGSGSIGIEFRTQGALALAMAAPAVNAVPLPAGMPLLLSALGLAFLLRRRGA